MSDPKQPALKINFYPVSAAIWRNGGPKGAFYSVDFQRTYKDGSTERHKTKLATKGPFCGKSITGLGTISISFVGAMVLVGRLAGVHQMRRW